MNDVSPALSKLCIKIKDLESKVNRFNESFQHLVDERTRLIENIQEQQTKLVTTMTDLAAYMSEICTACELMCFQKQKCPLTHATKKVSNDKSSKVDK